MYTHEEDIYIYIYININPRPNAKKTSDTSSAEVDDSQHHYSFEIDHDSKMNARDTTANIMLTRTNTPDPFRTLKKALSIPEVHQDSFVHFQDPILFLLVPSPSTGGAYTVISNPFPCFA